MEKIPARVYARQHRMSLFQVIRKIQKGELRGEQIEENGVKVQYVLLGPEPAPEPEEASGSGGKPAPSPAEHPLTEELRALRREISLLRRTLERCCEEREKSREAPSESAGFQKPDVPPQVV